MNVIRRRRTDVAAAEAIAVPVVATVQTPEEETPAQRREQMMAALRSKHTWNARQLRAEVMRQFARLGEVPGDGVKTAKPWERRIP